MAISKSQQAREADVVLRAKPGGWDVLKHRYAPAGFIASADRDALIREARLAVAPRRVKVLYLTEKEEL